MAGARSLEEEGEGRRHWPCPLLFFAAMLIGSLFLWCLEFPTVCVMQRPVDRNCAKKHAHVVCSCGLVNLLECLSGEATRNLWRAVPRLRKLPAALRVRKRRF